jgi:flavin reductase (DIM6/NTAB) family NADH-FMN oxidoreductase RutF
LIADPGSIPAQDIYKLLIGLIVPRPIAFVSTVDAVGARNLAPFSFFTCASADPPVIAFCPLVRGEEGVKDTLRNIRETQEFVVNIVSEEIAAPMNLSSGDYPHGVDEFEVSGLTPVPCDLVIAPRVKEAKASMECKLFQLVEVSGRRLGGTLVLGEVIRFHVDDAILERGRIDPDGLNAIGRMGGAAYCRTRDRFDMERPNMERPNMERPK